jgi:hypothetical protein
MFVVLPSISKLDAVRDPWRSRMRDARKQDDIAGAAQELAKASAISADLVSELWLGKNVERNAQQS